MSDAPADTSKSFRILPLVTEQNAHFWRGGADGELRFQRCTDCGYWLHPPSPVCGECLGRASAIEAVSGKAVLLTYTVNHHPWVPGFEPPYVIAIVELPEQSGLRLTTNLVNVESDDIEIGMPLRVVFEACDDDIHIPLFEPDPKAGA